MAGVFSAENVEVNIYLDDGTGNPTGSVLTLRFKRATGIDTSMDAELIPHAGYPYEEIAGGVSRCTVSFEHLIRSRSNDLRLTDALYYIEITNRTDDYTAYDKYICKKARRTAWSFSSPDSGVIPGRAAFICEQITAEAVL